MTSASPPTFFKGQLVHGVVLIALLAVYAAAAARLDFSGTFLGLTTKTWALIAIADAIVHQIYVWICWRAELRGKRLTALLGPRAFPLYKFGFAVLILLRPILAFVIAWANRGTAPIEPVLGWALGAVGLGLAGYLMYSVRRYFSFDRAFGIDHFDPAYRKMTLERRGIFAWSPNAMYVFGFLGLWAPGFLFQSEAALAVAAFSHAYIWVHYFCTEQPDMAFIYGGGHEPG